MDPFGGIKGKEVKLLSGFEIDKEEALRNSRVNKVI